MLFPIHARPLFRQGLHTKNGLDLLLAHGPVGLVKPYLLFLSSSAAPFTPFGPSLLCKRSIGVTVNIVMTVLCSWGRRTDIHER